MQRINGMNQSFVRTVKLMISMKNHWKPMEFHKNNQSSVRTMIEMNMMEPIENLWKSMK